MAVNRVRNTAGCEIEIGAFYGDTCPLCGANNFGPMGREFCRTERERWCRENEAKGGTDEN